MEYQRKPKRIEARQMVVHTTMTIDGLQVDIPAGAYLITEAGRTVRWLPEATFEANYEPYVEPEPEPEPVVEEKPGPEPPVARRKRA